jgi:hypothetical protein
MFNEGYMTKIRKWSGLFLSPPNIKKLQYTYNIYGRYVFVGYLGRFEADVMWISNINSEVKEVEKFHNIVAGRLKEPSLECCKQ